MVVYANLPCFFESISQVDFHRMLRGGRVQPILFGWSPPLLRCGLFLKPLPLSPFSDNPTFPYSKYLSFRDNEYITTTCHTTMRTLTSVIASHLPCMDPIINHHKIVEETHRVQRHWITMSTLHTQFNHQFCRTFLSSKYR